MPPAAEYTRISSRMDPEGANYPSQPPGTSVWRGRLMTAVKIGVTLGGLFLVLRRLDPALIARAISETDWPWMLAGAALIAASLVVRAWRWQVILRGSGADIPFRRLVVLYLVGTFFNAFLPSGIGGDVVRAAEAAQDVPATTAVSSVVIDRLTGLMALFILAIAVLPFRPADFPEPLLWIIISLSVSGLIAGFLLVDGRFASWLVNHLPPAVQNIGGGVLLRLLEAIDRCSGRALVTALLISMLFNLMQIGWWYTTGRALGLDVPYTYYMLVVPIMALAVLFPSVGGLGVRETLAPGLFGSVMLPEQAVALSLLVFGLERLASLLGAPVYLYTTLRDARSRRQEQEALHQQ